MVLWLRPRARVATRSLVHSSSTGVACAAGYRIQRLDTNMYQLARNHQRSGAAPAERPGEATNAAVLARNL